MINPSPQGNPMQQDFGPIWSALLPYIQAITGQMTPTGQATGATGQPNWLQALLGPAGQQQSSLDPMAAFWQQLMGSLLSPQNMAGNLTPAGAAPAATPPAPGAQAQPIAPQRPDSGDAGTGKA